jgi:hypothetical protein
VDHRPTPLLPWLIEKFAPDAESPPDYEKAARSLEEQTGYHVEPDTLRHCARAYKRFGGPFAAAIEIWTGATVKAVTLLTWPHYSRQSERAAG